MKTAAIQVRRKPRQSRAKLTQEALLESFVRLLHERPAHAITIREMTDLAGVGLGTFYEYFSKKEDLIALTIHVHVKTNAERLKAYAQTLVQQSSDLALADYLEHVIHFQLEQIQAEQFLWSQVFLLERQISDIESYRKSYAMMVQMWDSLLQPLIPEHEPRKRFSFNIQRICYSFISQALLIDPGFDQWSVLEQDMFSLLKPLAAAI